MQNALYGTYAINSWRFTDGFKICSAAITNSGQRLTKESIIFVDQYISDQLAKQIAKILNEDCGCDDRQEWMNEKTKIFIDKEIKLINQTN